MFEHLCYLTTHGVRIYLAHVCAAIIFLHVAYMQFPCIVTIVRNGESLILCYHMSVYRQYRFRIGFYPCHLKQTHPNFLYILCSKVRIFGFKCASIGMNSSRGCPYSHPVFQYKLYIDAIRSVCSCRLYEYFSIRVYVYNSIYTVWRTPWGSQKMRRGVIYYVILLVTLN